MPALTTVALLIFNAQTRAASTPRQFHGGERAIFPNELAVSVNKEVSYDDNVYRATKGDERGRWIFSTGLTAKWFRTSTYLTYGLEGEITYDHYHKAHELSRLSIHCPPILMGNLGVGTDDLYLNFYSTCDFDRLSNVDQRYARSYTNGVQAVWNLIDHERWGLAITGDWAYEYYPTKNSKTTPTTPTASASRLSISSPAKLSSGCVWV